MTTEAICVAPGSSTCEWNSDICMHSETGCMYFVVHLTLHDTAYSQPTVLLYASYHASSPHSYDSPSPFMYINYRASTRLCILI